MRDKIKMLSTGKTKVGKPTGTFRTTTKNKKKNDWKVENETLMIHEHTSSHGKNGMHVLFEETKI